MRILAICGSPRKGNTEFMLRTVLDAAKGEKELILLRDIKMKHCSGCSICMKEKTDCTIKDDDVAKILDKMVEADVVVFGSPTYFDNVPGLMKDFIDRMLPFFEIKKLKGKKAAIVVVGHLKLGEGSIEKAAEIMKNTCNLFEMNIVGQVFASSGTKKPAEDKKVVAELKKLGESL